jgi:mRNA interferase RelE/StbE
LNDGTWRLLVAGSTRRDLERVPEKYAAAIIELLPSITANPHRLGKPLRFEWEGCWVARRGPYRIIYALDKGARTVTVLAVAHRADVYRRR